MVVDGSGGGRTQYGTRSVMSSLLLTVSGARLDDHGDARRWRLSRLRWLDSTAGAEPAVPHPFTSVASTSATAWAASCPCRGWTSVTA